MAQRWRAIGTEHRGWRLALIKAQESGEVVRVYFRLGRWRMYRNDDPVRDKALAATARRALR